MKTGDELGTSLNIKLTQYNTPVNVNYLQATRRRIYAFNK